MPSFLVGPFYKIQVFFSSLIIAILAIKKYFSNFGIRNFRILTNDWDKICSVELADSIAVNRI